MKRKPSKKTCHKLQYKTPEDAKKAIKAFGRDMGATNWYKCNYHPGKTVYHLSSHDH